MHVIFNPDLLNWDIYSQPLESQQFGFGRGGQYGGLDYFQGVPFQRGAGLGSIFRGLIRFLTPVGKEVGSLLSRQGLESGKNILNSVLEGRDLKEVVKNEGKSALKNILNKAANNLTTQEGAGYNNQKTINKKNSFKGLRSFVGPPIKAQQKTKVKRKRLRKDILGVY